jgi:hypothetical protein
VHSVCKVHNAILHLAACPLACPSPALLSGFQCGDDFFLFSVTFVWEGRRKVGIHDVGTLYSVEL